VATLAGAHAERVARVRDLQTVKGRKKHGRFVFEGATLLDEALRSGVEIEELYVTESVLEGNAAVQKLDERGTPVYLVDERVASRISDLTTPTGLVAVAQERAADLATILSGRLTLVLADLNDPGNVGTLLRSAEAFGAQGVVVGSLGVDPYHPKVVRSAMGATFRIALAVASPQEFDVIAKGLNATVLGLAIDGDDIAEMQPGDPTVLLVGHERRGLGLWQNSANRLVAIPMSGPAESLNAAVAGSIALYIVGRNCQESPRGPKSQVYPG
jgi:RNA methyltransferase, TrmH family